MIKSKFTLALFACTALLFSTSCNRQSDNKTEVATENLKEERLDVLEAKVELTEAQNIDYLAFKEESERRFTKNGETINDLKIKILQSDEKFRTENQSRVGVLEQKNNSLQKEMSDYSYDGPEKWAAFTQKFNYDMDELTKALKDFTLLS